MKHKNQLYIHYSHLCFFMDMLLKRISIKWNSVDVSVQFIYLLLFLYSYIHISPHLSSFYRRSMCQASLLFPWLLILLPTYIFRYLTFTLLHSATTTTQAKCEVIYPRFFQNKYLKLSMCVWVCARVFSHRYSIFIIILSRM